MTTAEIRKKLAELLGQGKVMVVVDTTHRSTLLPPDFMTGASTPLIMSEFYPGIELEWKPRSVRATLKFGGKPFRCCIPYAAIQHMELQQSIGQPAPPKRETKTIGEQVRSGSQRLPITGLGRRGTLTLLK